MKGLNDSGSIGVRTKYEFSPWKGFQDLEEFA
jgi:hypothetical protein